jgi:DNA-directed RNA polymerase subunit RPC12/RpoP
MKCSYCGKEFEGEGASLYTQGELTAAYCMADCMGKAFKKMSQLVRKLGKKQLLELFDSLPTQSSPARCKDCKHIQKWACGGSIFFYCGITKSRRTQNGLKKVLCKTPACGLFEKEKQ